jgi:hypothetical protein
VKVDVPSELRWDIWRPVLAGLGTLAEVSELWSIIDLLDANLALDIREDVERKQYWARQ